MKKKLVMILMAVMVASATLGGCGQKGAETGTSVSAEEEDVQISYKELMKATDYKVQKYVKLNDYMNMTVELSQDYSITDEQIQEYIEYLLSMYPEYETTDKTTVENGDIVNIDYVGKVDGEEFNGGSATGQHLEIGSGSFIDGFEDGLIGKNVGDTVDLNLTFPEDYGSEDLAGKDVVFKVTINSIQDESYPTYDTLNDEYVKDNYNDYYGVSTVEELKKYVSDSLENNNNSAVGDALTDKLKEISKISDIPDSLTKERTKELKSYYKGMAKYQDQEFADFLQNTYGMSEDDFNKQIKELMPDYIKSDLVWEAVAAKEGIKASGEDYDKFVDKMMSTLKFDKKDDLFDVYPETMVKRMYIEQEAKDKLIKQAKVKYVETTSEDTTEQTQSDGSDTGNTDNTSENAEVKDTIDTTTGK